MDIEETITTPSVHNDPDFATVKTEDMEEIENPGEFVQICGSQSGSYI